MAENWGAGREHTQVGDSSTELGVMGVPWGRESEGLGLAPQTTPWGPSEGSASPCETPAAEPCGYTEVAARTMRFGVGAEAAGRPLTGTLLFSLTDTTSFCSWMTTSQLESLTLPSTVRPVTQLRALRRGIGGAPRGPHTAHPERAPRPKEQPHLDLRGDHTPWGHSQGTEEEARPQGVSELLGFAAPCLMRRST